MAILVKRGWPQAAAVAVVAVLAAFAVGCPAEPKEKPAPTGPKLKYDPARMYVDVTGIFWSADGKRIATTSTDGTMTIWNVDQGDPARWTQTTLGKQGDPHANVTSDGRLLVESTEGKFTVRNFATGIALHVLDQSEHVVAGGPIFLFDNGKRLLSFHLERQEFNIWDTTTGKLIDTKIPKTELRLHGIFGVSSDAKEVYATFIRPGGDKRPIEGITVIELASGRTELRIRHPLPLTTTYDSPVVSSGHIFLEDRYYDLATGKKVDAFTSHWNEIWAIDPNGRLAAVPEKEWRISVLDLKQHKLVGILPKLAISPGWPHVVFSPDGKYLATGGRRDWNSERVPRDRRRSGNQPTPTEFADDRVLLIYDVQTQKRVRTLAFPLSPGEDSADPEIP